MVLVGPLFFLLPGVLRRSTRRSLPGASPLLSSTIGEGTLSEIPDADASIANAASFGSGLLVVVCVFVLVVDLVAAFSQEGPVPVDDEKKKYVLRWIGKERTRFENLGVGDLSEEGLNSRSFDSLEEMNAVAKNIDNLDMPYSTYSVKGKQVQQLRSFDRKNTKNRNLQAIWDQELTELAEDEAALKRGPLDEEWTTFRQQNFELTRDVKKNFDVEIVDRDERDANTCRLCNGKGYRVIFGEESGPCERCRGTGTQKSLPS